MTEQQLELPFHTGTVSQQEADVQTEAVKQIMADTGMNFGDAVNEYIARTGRCRNCAPDPILWPRQEVDMSGWDAA